MKKEKQMTYFPILSQLLRDKKGMFRKCYYNETAIGDFIQKNKNTDIGYLWNKICENNYSVFTSISETELDDVIRKYEETASNYGVYDDYPKETEELMFKLASEDGDKVTDNYRRNRGNRANLNYNCGGSCQEVHGLMLIGEATDEFDEDRYWKIPLNVLRFVIGKSFCETKEDSDKLKPYKCYYSIKNSI